MLTLAMMLLMPVDVCAPLAKIAEQIMTARQNQTPITTVMDVMTTVDDANEQALMRALVLAAYEEPAFSSDRYKAKAIVEFQNKTYLACAKARQ